MASPKSRPRAHTTRPHMSSARPPIPPRKVAWDRSGRTREASPPACCAAVGGEVTAWAAAVDPSNMRPARASAAVNVGFVKGDGLLERCVVSARLLVGVLVVFDAQVRDLVFAHHPAQRVLELGLLNEEVVLGIETGGHLRALKVEGQPFLNTEKPGPVRQIEEERQVEDDGRRENRVAAQEVDLDLHRVAEPPE